MKPFEILYKRTQTGAIQQWQIIVDNNTFYTEEGIVGGKITKSLPTICESKNIGKTNETTEQEQAEKEALSKWNKKREDGYFEDISRCDEGPAYFEPMLAQKYEDHKHKLGAFQLYAQPKLDGMRCIVKKDGMWSRNGKKIVSAPHIYNELKPLFDIDANLIFDGELYADKLNDDFNKIMSLAKKTKPTQKDIEESAHVLEYHIYDFPSFNGTFSQRYQAFLEIIKNITQVKVKIVKTIEIHTETELDNCYQTWLEEGYEGQIIRVDNTEYENKRTDQLLKRKEFQDKEFKILDICEGAGNRSGMAGYAIMDLGDDRIFRSNIKGTHGYCKELLKNREQVIGKIATIQFFNLTPDGIPRFPFMKGIRDYE